MRRTLSTPSAALTALVLVLVVAGCNALGITDSDDDEVRVTVRAKGADFLDADDNFRYTVGSYTEYEGFSGFADVTVGAIVEIEFEETSTNNVRRALEMEADGRDDG
jgi:hypothetical protein